MSLHLWTSARFTFPVPPGHRFPIAKYEALRRRVVASGIVPPDHVHEPRRVERAALLRVHTPEYVGALTAGTLTAQELRRLGFPWSPALVERSDRAVEGTGEAAVAAVSPERALKLRTGVA